MSLIKWEPFSEFDRFFNELAPLSSSRLGLSTDLAVDVYEEGSNYIAEMNIPGMSKDNISVKVKDNHLVVSGANEHKEEHQKNIQGRNYFRKEIRSGSFERVVPLPGHVQKGQVSAEYKHGKLKVTLPKADEDEALVKVDVKE